MFRAAYALARKYTFPVVISRKTVAGKCSGTIGAFIVVNDEGWFVTCYHIVKTIADLQAAEQHARAIENQVATINKDTSLSNSERKRRLAAVPRLQSSDTDRMSVFWGVKPNVQINVKEGFFDSAVDLAIGKFDPFDSTWVAAYPEFKDPSKAFEPGASVCKLGYPFHTIVPQWDASNNRFIFPLGSVPVPLFPIEGILTRFANVVVTPQTGGVPPAQTIPWKMLETSTPGLRGQSGGPVFDSEGAIWGIQSQTVNYPLGFNPPVPNSSKGEKVPQFLNVGRAIHAESVIAFLKQHGVKFAMSKH